MSLSKRKELADIKAKNMKLVEQRVAHYSKLQKSAVGSAKDDFVKFFTEQDFAIQSPGQPSYPSSNSTVATASYQTLNARFEHDQENPRYITLLSNIKGYGELDYKIAILVKNPKAPETSSGAYMIPQDEEKRLEQELQRARKDLEYSELAISGLAESKALFMLHSQKSARNPGNDITYNREGNDFYSLLKYLFDE